METLTQGQKYTDPAGRSGTVQFDANTGKPLMQGQTTTTNPVPPVTPTTSAGAIGTKPMYIPPTDPVADAGKFNGLVNSNNADLMAAQQDVTNAGNDRQAGLNDLTALYTQLGKKSQDQLDANAAAGVPDLNKNLLDLQNQARQKMIEYNTTPYSLQGQGRGITTGILRGQEAVKQRQVGIDNMVINSQIQATQGQIGLAQATAKAAIDAKYDPILQDIELKKFMIDQNKDIWSEAQKRQADAKQKEWDLQVQQVKDAKDNENKISDMVLQARAQGVPSSLADAASKQTDPLKAAQILGKYSGDYLKAETLRSQLETDKVQRAKLYADIANTKADTAKKQADAATTPKPGTNTELENRIGTESLDLLNKLKKGNAPIGAAYIGFNLPGTQRADFVAKFNTVKSLLSLDNIKYLKGQGAISDGERVTLEEASATLKRNMSPAEFEKSLTNVVNVFNKNTPENKYVDHVTGLLNNVNTNLNSSSSYAASILNQ
jgi:hypothetical protein